MNRLQDQHLIINLDRRKDRLDSARKEFAKLGIDEINRMPAIPNEIGMIGCGESHKRCLEIAIQNEWDYVLICEDDVVFIDPERIKRLLQEYLDFRFDVLLIGANVLRGRLVNEDLVRVEKSECFHAYIVRSHYYFKLLSNFREGLEKLKKDPNNMMCNIDVYNQSLQKNDKWFCFNPSLATQQVGYSDNFKMIHDQSHRILHHNLY